MTQGIFGIIDFSRRIVHPDEIIRKMSALEINQGGNKEKLSYITGDNYFFAMKRNAVGSVGQQSQIAVNKGLQAICSIHGEINNYKELLKEYPSEGERHNGDLDLAIRLYRTYGPEFIKKLNGLFSLALLDQRDSIFILLNDRFGLAHQVYWSMNGSIFYFATHLKTLLTISGIKREIEHEGLNLFLKYSYIPSPWTILKAIRKLPAGHLLTFKEGKVEDTPYWGYSASNNHLIDIQDAVSEYKDLLKKSISRRLGTNEKVGILLSGGLDSSANVALAADCTDQQLKTLSVGFEDPAFDERPYAKIVSRRFSTEHYETVVTEEDIEDLPKLIWHLEEPYFEFGLFLTYKALLAAQNEVDTVIGGEGTDQLFGTGGFAGGRPAALHYLLLKYRLLGMARRTSCVFQSPYFYNHDNLPFKFRMLWNRATDLNNWYFYGFDQHELLKLYRDRELATIPDIFPDRPDSPPCSLAEFFQETQINQDLKHYVNENVMVKSGRMAAMLGLTLRESYLDTDVTDFLTSLDFPLKREGGLSAHLRGNITAKYLHKKAMEDLLPQEILNKPKQGGFVPVMIFLRKPDMRKRIYHHLFNSEVIKEYFRTDYLKKIFDSYEHMQGRKIYWHNFYNAKANQILFLLSFDIWHHFYMQNPIRCSVPTLTDYLG
jgi:asparagine synthase (glutamine-hydrolysing)